MKCQYCGKDLAPGSLFCDGCGAKVNDGGYNNPPQNNGYGAMTPKKGNTGLKVTIILLSVLLVGLIVGLYIGLFFGVIFLLLFEIIFGFITGLIFGFITGLIFGLFVCLFVFLFI